MMSVSYCTAPGASSIPLPMTSQAMGAVGARAAGRAARSLRGAAAPQPSRAVGGGGGSGSRSRQYRTGCVGVRTRFVRTPFRTSRFSAITNAVKIAQPPNTLRQQPGMRS